MQQEGAAPWNRSGGALPGP